MSYLKCSLRTSDSAVPGSVRALNVDRLQYVHAFKLVNPLLQRLEMLQQVAAIAIRGSHISTL